MMEVQMASSNEMHESWGMDSNMDEIKEMFLDTNVYLVTITMIVSLLHSIFEFLAIKNGKLTNLTNILINFKYSHFFIVDAAFIVGFCIHRTKFLAL